ncbi:MAG: reactivating factor for ethanolamine ammonia lyase [Chloroflexi bacterium]|nr:reactivating factor for ethanolamine ammonia lyase [Chloroflexota bacterium]
MANEHRVPAYQRWMVEEGVPIVRGHGVSDVMTLELGDWKRMGGQGAFIDMTGMEGLTGLYVVEIPPGGSLKAERHMYDELMYVLSGRGSTEVWAGDAEQSASSTVFEWQAGALFSPPMNTWHRLYNLSGDEPARLLSATLAPLVMDVYHNAEFVFDCPFTFRDRFDGRPDYFNVGERTMNEPTGSWVWDTSYIPDVRWDSLKEDSRKTRGAWSTVFEMGGNILAGHIYEFPAGRYQKAHYHSGGAIVVTVRGAWGYSLMWPKESGIRPYENGNADKVVRIDWKEGSVVSPPGDWFHQHFNTGPEPVRQLALRLGSQRHGVYFHDIQTRGGVLLSVAEGGTMIEYDDEDPEIPRLFQEELARWGAKSHMDDPTPTWAGRTADV